jgi:cytidine deaminase
MCAERNAIATAVGQGVREIRGLVVVCSGDVPPAPCGACRQVLAEFPPAFEVRCYARDGQELIAHSDALLPHAFDAKALAPNQR